MFPHPININRSSTPSSFIQPQFFSDLNKLVWAKPIINIADELAVLLINMAFIHSVTVLVCEVRCSAEPSRFVANVASIVDSATSPHSDLGSMFAPVFLAQQKSCNRPRQNSTLLADTFVENKLCKCQYLTPVSLEDNYPWGACFSWPGHPFQLPYDCE